MRRSFKEDREDRRKRKTVRTRYKILGATAVVLVVGAVVWGVYAQTSISAMIGGWHQAKAQPRATVTMHTIGSAIHPVKQSLLFGASPTPGVTPTPVVTPTPAATPTETPSVKKTPKPHAAPLTKVNRQLVAFASPFTSGPTPAPLATPAPTPAPTAAPTTAPAAEVYAPQIIVDARFSNRVQPDYPEIAREQHIEGTAVVLVTVGPKGNVISQRLEKSAGHPLLDQAALSAAARSSFQPPRIDGKAATETYRIVYAFTS